ncbi:hypothetical protein LCGC14_2107470, partial [marine sediment metagenome]
EDGSDADGVTGYIVQTGQEVLANSYEEVKAHPAHKGKWDEVQWDDKPEKYFKCLFGVPLISEEKILGVLKIENKITEPRLFDSHDQQTLRDYAKIVAQELHKILQRDISLKMIDEYEYRLVRHKKRIFEKKAVGGVTLKHSLTSISPSEVDYFIHNKDPSKLDDRLPMPLGHETTAFVQYTKGNITYYFEPLTRIQQGDAVVVIPLIPCGSCEICTGGYGENYCMSSRFMASNAPGSLRTLYKYYKDLLLKIPINLDEKYALMTQPMSVVMQALMEFGFKEDSYRFPITYKKHHQTFPYFHVPQDDFTNIFNTITSAEPFPRTVFFIDTNDDKSKFEEKYYISLYNLQRKGLAIYGDDLYNFLDKRKELYGSNPKVLILGNGTVGYLMALLLSFVFKIPKERLYVTGRTDALFLVAGGPIEVVSMFGNVTTIIASTPGNVSINLNSTNDAYDSDLSIVVALADGSEGDTVVFGALTNSENAGVLTANESASIPLSWFISVGSIEQTLSGTGTGAVTWYMTFRPLTTGVTVVVQ